MGEAQKRGLNVEFHVADMRDLTGIQHNEFDAVVVADNALPHLLMQEDRERALCQIAAKLRTGGVMLATVRDYDRLVETRPAIQPPSFFGERGQRCIVHQVWDWEGSEYDVHLHICYEHSGEWVVKHYVSRYTALRRNDLNASLQMAGLRQVEWIEPGESGFYQPILIARKTVEQIPFD